MLEVDIVNLDFVFFDVPSFNRLELVIAYMV